MNKILCGLLYLMVLIIISTTVAFSQNDSSFYYSTVIKEKIDPINVRYLTMEKRVLTKKKLPRFLKKFTKLRELELGPIIVTGHDTFEDISGNFYHQEFALYYLYKLKKLPEWLIRLEHLTHLSIGHGIKENPEKMLNSIVKLTNLREFNLDVKFLSPEIVRVISLMTHLQKLKLGVIKPDEKTESYVENLKKALPGCNFTWEDLSRHNYQFIPKKGRGQYAYSYFE